MNTYCAHCEGELPPGSPRQGFEGGYLCNTCNVAEIKAMLRDCDASELTKLRRRVEDHLRKSPADLLDVGARLAAAGRIRIDDLI